MRILFSTVARYISLGIANFLDNFFERANTTGGLGTSTSGATWNPVNGLINVVSGAAKASTVPTTYSAGSAYPMSTVSMTGSNVDIKLKGTNQGSAAAIWVQSADEWWAVTARAVQTSTPGNTNYGYQYTGYVYNYSYYGNAVSLTTGSGTTATGTNANTKVAYFVYGFSSSTTYSVAGYNIAYSASYGTKYNSKYSIAYNKYTWATYGANYSSSTSYSYKVNSTYYGYVPGNTNYGWYNYYQYYNYYYGPVYTSTSYYAWYTQVTGSNATTYGVNQYIDIIQSTPSAVSTISSILVSTTQTILSMLVSISGTQITTKAYSDSNLVSQIGSNLVYNATGAVVSTNFGITVSPSQYNQSDIIGTSVQIDVV